MEDHKYSQEMWNHYYHDNLDEDTRAEMTMHLMDCSICFNMYTKCVDEQIIKIPITIENNVINAINIENKKKQLIKTYIAAACMALIMYSSGIFDTHSDRMQKGIDKSLGTVVTMTNSFNDMTKNIVWRDYYGEK